MVGLRPFRVLKPVLLPLDADQHWLHWLQSRAEFCTWGHGASTLSPAWWGPVGTTCAAALISGS